MPMIMFIKKGDWIMKKSLLIIMIVFIICPSSSLAEMKKLSDYRLKNIKAGTGDLVGTVFGEYEEKPYISDIRKGFDILESDRSGTWEKTGMLKSENGLVTIDQTITTTGMSYENIGIKGAPDDAKSFGSIHIGQTSISIKGQMKVTYIP